MRTVADVMKKNAIVTVPQKMTVTELVALFEEKLISGVPVLDGHGKMVGMVSRTDIINRLFRIGSIEGARVEDLMTPFVLKVSPHEPLDRLVDVMLSSRIHRVVVTLEDEPVGVITSLDLLEDYQHLLMGALPSVTRTQL